MFDARRRLRRGFLQDRRALARRFRAAAAAHAAAAPFLLAFLLLYFFLREAEGVYHRPGGVGERAWAPAARWRLREFLEPRHALENRLAAGAGAAGRYLALFPAHVAAHAARLAAFAAGAAAALLLALAAADESLLEVRARGGRRAGGRGRGSVGLRLDYRACSSTPPPTHPHPPTHLYQLHAS
jgi:autophagy-related protein 9